ncbi:MAG TPA: phosphatase PAP2 family protein [Candidatus Dormibacteraeota bacterium]|jgi:undecaprenyl-diphosphatase|nr:phosphatase PAP2 family protein [Candidatus Dormibacteraeota bacterium]
MSLGKRSGFDLNSLINSVRSSLRIVIACIVGFFLAWLIFWQIDVSLNNSGAVGLYNLVSSNAQVVLVGVVATLGNSIWIPIVFYLYVLRRGQYDWTSALVLAVAMVSAMSLTDVLKMAFGLPRPFQDPALGISARFETPADHGLPSGHTASAFTVATVMWTRFSKWRVPFATLAVATGVSMVILGLHYPSDIIAGAFVGIFCGTFAINLAKTRNPREA